MKVYLDSSAVLRLILDEKGPSVLLAEAQVVASSILTETECRRTLDRLRLAGRLEEEPYGEGLARVREFLTRVDLIELTSALLRRAGDPLPVPLGTLDALHLATARTLQESTGESWHVATHDTALARAARLTGLGVLDG